jgi:hypothetical protein
VAEDAARAVDAKAAGAKDVAGEDCRPKSNGGGVKNGSKC